MNSDIALLLAQDGLTNAAVYALLALAFVLVFTVTRIIFVPQGEFVTYGALTLASIQAGKYPTVVWLLLSVGAFIAVRDGTVLFRRAQFRSAARLWSLSVGVPSVIAVLCWLLVRPGLPLLVQIALALATVIPLGPMIYHAAFRPAVGASVLVLLIIAVSVHFVMESAGLILFGAEGSRTTPIAIGSMEFGNILISAQSVCVIGVTILLIAVLYLCFARTIVGKALRATAINETGARLVGIGPVRSGTLCCTLAAGIGALSGVLISPITAIYYDTGLVIGLKGLVAATVGGFLSYPLAALGAVIVGLLEAFASFSSSPFKEVIVFALVIPILLVRALVSQSIEGEEE